MPYSADGLDEACWVVTAPRGGKIGHAARGVVEPSFIQAALLVALTGALSGFLIPWIKGRTDDKKARQQKIVDAQSEVLDELTMTLWEIRYLLMGIAYDRLNGPLTTYDSAIEGYRDEITALFSRFRIAASTAGRLVPAGAYERLIAFYDNRLTTLEGAVSEAIRERPPNRASDEGTKTTPDHDHDWLRIHQDLRWQFTTEIDSLLTKVARDFRLLPKR